MIFDSTYDKSLWFMLKGDKSNRDKIVQFIKAIPEDLYLMIQESLVKYNKYKVDGNTKVVSFNGQTYGSFGDIYWFNIDTNTGSLWLGRCVLTCGDLYFDDFEIELSSYDHDSELRYFSKQSIGEVSFDYGTKEVAGQTYLGDCTEVKYNLMKVPFGSLLLSYNENLPCIKTRVRKIDTRKMISDYNISNIDSIIE